MTRYFYVLPPELSDLKNSPEVEKAINQAWFHRKSGQSDTDLQSDFYVTLDGCLCHFSVDRKRTGYLNGQYVVTVSGVALQLTSMRQNLWEQRLKDLENSLNGQIAQNILGGKSH